MYGKYRNNKSNVTQQVAKAYSRSNTWEPGAVSNVNAFLGGCIQSLLIAALGFWKLN
jgi:hypothetical protein